MVKTDFATANFALADLEGRPLERAENHTRLALSMLILGLNFLGVLFLDFLIFGLPLMHNNLGKHRNLTLNMDFKTEVSVIVREKHYLSPLEVKIIQESERAQTITNVLISTMSREFVQEEEAADQLEQELKRRKKKMESLRTKMESLKKDADSSYSSTIDLILSSMKSKKEDTSWKAKVVFEDGLPSYVEIESENSQNPDS